MNYKTYSELIKMSRMSGIFRECNVVLFDVMFGLARGNI